MKIMKQATHHLHGFRDLQFAVSWGSCRRRQLRLFWPVMMAINHGICLENSCYSWKRLQKVSSSCRNSVETRFMRFVRFIGFFCIAQRGAAYFFCWEYECLLVIHPRIVLAFRPLWLAHTQDIFMKRIRLQICMCRYDEQTDAKYNLPSSSQAVHITHCDAYRVIACVSMDPMGSRNLATFFQNTSTAWGDWDISRKRTTRTNRIAREAVCYTKVEAYPFKKAFSTKSAKVIFITDILFKVSVPCGHVPLAFWRQKTVPVPWLTVTLTALCKSNPGLQRPSGSWVCLHMKGRKGDLH
jgi:hypothetical protein